MRGGYAKNAGCCILATGVFFLPYTTNSEVRCKENLFGLKSHCIIRTPIVPPAEKPKRTT